MKYNKIFFPNEKLICDISHVLIEANYYNYKYNINNKYNYLIELYLLTDKVNYLYNKAILFSSNHLEGLLINDLLINNLSTDKSFHPKQCTIINALSSDPTSIHISEIEELKYFSRMQKINRLLNG